MARRVTGLGSSGATRTTARLVFCVIPFVLRFTLLCVLPPKPHGDESIGREIRLQKFSGCARSAKQSFGGEIAAAHSPFHRRGPAGVRPVARQEQTWQGGLLLGTPAINSRLRGK